MSRIAVFAVIAAALLSFAFAQPSAAEMKREVLTYMREHKRDAPASPSDAVLELYTGDDRRAAVATVLADFDLLTFSGFVLADCLDGGMFIGSNLPDYSDYVERQIFSELGFIPACDPAVEGQSRLRLTLVAHTSANTSEEDYPFVYVIELIAGLSNIHPELRLAEIDEYDTFKYGVTDRRDFLERTSYSTIDGLIRDFADEVFAIWRAAGLVER